MLEKIKYMDSVSATLIAILIIAAISFLAWAQSRRLKQAKEEYELRMDEVMAENAKQLTEIKETNSLLKDIRDILAKIN